MALAGYVSEVLVAALQLFLGLMFSIFTVSMGISLLDKLTKGYEEWELIKKGNVAVGVLYGAVVLSLIVMVEPAIATAVLSIHNAIFFGSWITFALDLLSLLLTMVISILVIYTILRVINSLTTDVDEFGAIMKGNVSMAILIGAMVFAISFVMRIAIMYLIVALTGVI